MVVVVVLVLVLGSRCRVRAIVRGESDVLLFCSSNNNNS